VKKDIETVIKEMLVSSIGQISRERGISLEGGPPVEVERGRREVTRWHLLPDFPDNRVFQ